MSNREKAVSLDALLLFVLVVATMDQVPDDLSFWKGTFPLIHAILPVKPELMVFGDPLKPLYNVFKVSMLMAYLFVDLLPVSNERWRRAFLAIKLIIISSIVSMTVIVPSVNWIAARHFTGPSSYAHDGGVVQTEEAMKFLLNGENPYSATYENTPVKDAVNPALWQRYGIKGNPIIDHYTYPPLAFLASVPFLKASTSLIGWYDQRFFYLLLFALTLVLAYKIPPNTASRLPIVIALSLNPFSVPGIKEGMNDILLLFLLVATVYLLKTGRAVAASVMLALACGSKQMAWVMVPFFFTYLYGSKKEAGIKDIVVFRGIVVFISIIAAIFLPFLIWDGHALISDILSFHGGTTSHPYPLRGDAGYGFANLILHFGLVDSVTAYFPFTLIQAVFTLPLLGWLLFRQVKGNSLDTMLAGYTLMLFAFLFLGRYMAGNYIGLILSLLTVSYLMQERSCN